LCRSSAFALFVWVAALARAAAAAEEPSALISRALRAREARDFPAAIRLLEDAVAREPRPAWLGLLAETLAWEKQFPRAEALYRRALAGEPGSRDLSLGLGRVLLWEGRYADARAVLEPLVAQNAADADALEALGLAAYWSGDFRAAQRGFRRVLALRPSSPDARRYLDEIASASRATWEAGVGGTDDDQPFRSLRLATRVSLFSDPLTRWDVSAGTSLLEAPDAPDPRGDAPWVRVGGEVVFPSAHLTATGWLETLRAPDGASLGLWGLVLKTSLDRAGALSLAADRREILFTRASVADHPSLTRAGVVWAFGPRAGWSAGAEAFALRYFDGNRGVSLAAWALAPLAAFGSFRLSAGPAVSYRDTDETRFALVGTDASALPSGGYAYTYIGAYVPYWTPVGLREARVAAALDGTLAPGLTAGLRGDAGWAHDEAAGFGPDTGAGPAPAATYAFTYGRDFHPWRFAATLAWTAAGGTRLEIAYEHRTTVYYRSDALHASVVGHF
jgi:tetratricopeptide (TPR) repeat protein